MTHCMSLGSEEPRLSFKTIPAEYSPCPDSQWGKSLQGSRIVVPALGLPLGPDHAHLRTTTQNDQTLFSLKCLDPGSGRKLPAIWHGDMENPGVTLIQKSSTENGQ